MTSIGKPVEGQDPISSRAAVRLATDGVVGHVPVTMATTALWAPHLSSGACARLPSPRPGA